MVHNVSLQGKKEISRDLIYILKNIDKVLETHTDLASHIAIPYDSG